MEQMNKALVSILIPAYNSEAFISRAIESALAQTYEQIEIIIVDNASTDNTYEIASGYARKHDNLKVFSNERDIGPVGNWRRCAELASGRYACLLFSDDWYEPEFVSETVSELSAPDIGFVYSAVTHSSGLPRGNTVMHRLGHDGTYPSKYFIEDQLYLRNTATPFSPCCALFRLNDMKTALSTQIPDTADVGYTRHGAGHDLLIYLQTARRYDSFRHINKPLVNFCLHHGNLSLKPETNLAYILVKAWFAVSIMTDSGFNMKKFRAAHLWKLAMSGKLHLYGNSLHSDRARWHIDWLDIVRYLFSKISAAFNNLKWKRTSEN